MRCAWPPRSICVYRGRSVRLHHFDAFEKSESQSYLFILADKGYNADYVVAKSMKIKNQALISSKFHPKNRNIFTNTFIKSENLWSIGLIKLITFWCLATGYDTMESVFLAYVTIEGIFPMGFYALEYMFSLNHWFLGITLLFILIFFGIRDVSTRFKIFCFDHHLVF
ncbi:hypothetical protein HCUR_00651 [Holospora curviuscula]|uniref:Uncharacterized protein n=1 Tax=Holospora curviuscula TaxID=1082868 RepID=A0A2S5R9A7_9PROT|nr:hypothetical protein HCUR_00651 [Holospora curviuscula]